MSEYASQFIGQSIVTALQRPAIVVPRPRHITPGAFKDRLGMDALAIASSTHPACLALRGILEDRNYVDLDRADLPVLLGMLQSTGQPAINALFPGAGPITSDKIITLLTSPVLDSERP